MSCKASLFVRFFISSYYSLAIFPRKYTDSLLLCHVYAVALFFSLYGMYVVRYFSLMRGVFFTFFWVGCIFYISLILKSISSINQSKRYHVLQNCILPYGLGQDRFQIIEGTEPPEEVHKKTIINWCDQLNCCKMFMFWRRRSV